MKLSVMPTPKDAPVTRQGTNSPLGIATPYVQQATRKYNIK